MLFLSLKTRVCLTNMLSHTLRCQAGAVAIARRCKRNKLTKTSAHNIIALAK